MAHAPGAPTTGCFDDREADQLFTPSEAMPPAGPAAGAPPSAVTQQIAPPTATKATQPKAKAAQPKAKAKAMAAGKLHKRGPTTTRKPKHQLPVVAIRPPQAQPRKTSKRAQPGPAQQPKSAHVMTSAPAQGHPVVPALQLSRPAPSTTLDSSTKHALVRVPGPAMATKLPSLSLQEECDQFKLYWGSTKEKRRLGQGTFGVVTLSMERTTGRLAARKKMAVKDYFHKEFVMATVLHVHPHPHVLSP